MSLKIWRASARVVAGAVEAMAAAASIYASPAFVGHSLWMVPKGAGKLPVITPSGASTTLTSDRACTAALATFQRVVREQAAVFGSPAFLPHVTLVAGMMVRVGCGRSLSPAR